MIKFKKMSTTAKVVSGVGVTAVAGVALIPVINTFVPNEKAKVKYYSFNHSLYATKSDAEAAKAKLTAMSGLVGIMHGDHPESMKIDYKPLMAEFVSFVSKLFVIKVFKMDKDANGIDRFRYDGMSPEEKQKLLEQEIDGQIHYGDLKDMTSLVKYAVANKQGSDWMFTPVDNMMLSVLGDGSAQAYSQNELQYAVISKTISKLKAEYENIYKKNINDKFGQISYSLVHGLTHHNDDELQAADHAKSTDVNVNEGDGSGDEYTQELISKYQKWGTLKVALEDSKNALATFVSTNSISDNMKPIYQKMVAEHALVGWNNIERYSSDEVLLRDLLARVATERAQLSNKVLPGGHVDTSVNIVHGWNWEASGDQTGRDYEQWQIDLAKDMQERQRLLSLNLVAAPAGATTGKNYKPTGDGSGRDYAQSVLDLAAEFEKAGSNIGDLTGQINALINGKVIPAPPGGKLGENGQHQAATGLKDDIDYSPSWALYQQYLNLQQALADAQKKKDDFDNGLKNVMMDITPGVAGSGQHQEYELIHKFIDFDKAVQDLNAKQNFDIDQVDLTAAKAIKVMIEDKIKELMADGIIPAPEGAVSDNTAGTGDKSGNSYSADQIKLRDLKLQQHNVNLAISEASLMSIRQAKTGGMLSPLADGKHAPQVGLGDDKIYLQYFVTAAKTYREYQSSLSVVMQSIKDLEDKYKTNPGGHGISDLVRLHADSAQPGHNSEEGYTKEEIQVTKEAQLLNTLQQTLASTQQSLDQLKTQIGITEEEKLKQLRADAEAVLKDPKTIPPKAYGNEEPGGDKSGHNYQPPEVDYEIALEKLKKEFPEGNPWFKPTTADDKKSDAAYKELFNDWVQAVEGKTLEHNTAAKGDGTGHKFDSKNFDVFNTFYKKVLVDQYNSGDDARQSKIITDIDTIIKYFEDHNTLTMPTSLGYPSYTEPITPGSGEATGDGSGHTYLDIGSISGAMSRAYIGTRHNPSAYATETNLWTEYNKLSNADPTELQKQIDAQQKIVDHIQGLIDAAQTASTDAETEKSNKNTAVAEEQGAITHFLQTLGQAIDPLPDSEKKTLSEYITNHAKLISQGDMDLLNQQDQLATAIGEEVGIANSAQEAYSNALNAATQAMHDWYNKNKAYTDKMKVGHNNLYTGDGSGATYSMDQINGRDTLKAIKDEINTHAEFDTDQKKADELQKILGIKDSSSVGLNGNGVNGKLLGDTSGKTYASWEVTPAMLAKVNQLNDINKNIGSAANYAPEHATFGKNIKQDGAGNGRDYTQEQVDFAKKMQKLEKAKEAADKKLSSDRATKATIDGQIKAKGIDPTKNYDPTKIFLAFDKDGKSHKYTMEQRNEALQWKTLNDEKVKREIAYRNANAAVQQAASHLNKVKQDNQDAQKTAQKIIDDNKRLIAKLKDPAAVQKAWQKATDARTAFENGADYKAIKKWWSDNAGKFVDTDDPHNRFGGAKIAGSFLDFVDTSGKKDGSYLKIIRMMNRSKANTDGKVNQKVSHSEEQLKLRDALKDLMVFQAPISTPKNSEFSTDAFYGLLLMYQNAVSKGYWAKPDHYTEITGLGRSDVKIANRGKGNGDAHFQLPTTGNFKSDNPDDRVLTMADFKKWLKSYFTSTTAVINTAPTGSGKDEKFPENFFSANGKPLLDGNYIMNSELGKYAFTVAGYQGVHQKFGEHWIPGLNSKGTGDGSGNYYSDDEITYYNKYLQMLQQSKAVDDQKAVVGKFGRGIIHAPSGYDITKAVAMHKEPSGDGSGNDYDPSLIADANLYDSLKRQEKDWNDKIAALQKDYEDQHQHDTGYRNWDEVKAIPSTVAAGLNHQTYWSQAELDYDGKIIQGKQLARDIKDLENQGPTSPVGAGVVGGTTDTHKLLVAAPIGAIQGINLKPQGKQDGSKYDAKQIAKRDLLKGLHQDLTDTDAEILRLTTLLLSQGVTEAPSTLIGDGVDPTKEHWQKDPVGDGSGNTYDKKIFDDRTKLGLLQDALDTATQARDAFVAKIGQGALDTILDEVSRGMVNGVNNKERYSTSEIALRDHTAKLGSESDHLNLLKTASGFGLSQLITPESIVGPNIEAKGAADDETYSDEEIYLRDLKAKIKTEELAHGITSETDLAKMKVFAAPGASLSTVSSSMAATTTTPVSPTATTPAQKASEARATETTLSETVFDVYTSIDLKTANVGDKNHYQVGDGSGLYYDAGDVQTFTDTSLLAAKLQSDDAHIKALEDKGVTPAPRWGEEVSPQDVTEAAKVGDTSVVAGSHKLPVGDQSDKIYSKDDIDKASKYVQLVQDVTDATNELDAFIKANENEVAFFKFKTQSKTAAQSDTDVWNPIVGRNWASYNFDLKAKLDERDKLQVGNTMVNIDPATPASMFGTNRGHLGDSTDQDQRLVIYQGNSAPAYIRTEVQGSDKVRIGYVLNPSGSLKIASDAPVLTSLESVADYLQKHPELISKELMEKFGLLGVTNLEDKKHMYDIIEETVSKDTYRSMQENYKWGDE